jgi:transcriptional regulator with XRE-family HTH domain
VTATTNRPVGLMLREWRERRRLSQLELASQADVSTRHLSYVETGRSRPTSQMIVRLAGGYAPRYPMHDLAEPELAGVRTALRQVLVGHEPYPALVLNRWWEIVEANAAVPALLDGVAPELLEPPVNVLRVSLHPGGLAPRIANLAQWRAHLIGQLDRRRGATGDPRLHRLAEELRHYPGGDGPAAEPTEVVLPLRLRTGDGELALFSISAQVATAADVTVEELVVESFYPADEPTAAALRRISVRGPS